MSLQQELFDKVATHLLTQNERSVCNKDEDEEICVYRDDDNQRVLKCAIGALIDDKFYDPSLEGESFYNSNRVQEAIKRSQNIERDFTSIEIDMLAKLQTIHDCNPVEEWHIELSKLATEYLLSQEALNNFINIH